MIIKYIFLLFLIRYIWKWLFLHGNENKMRVRINTMEFLIWCSIFFPFCVTETAISIHNYNHEASNLRNIVLIFLAWNTHIIARRNIVLISQTKTREYIIENVGTAMVVIYIADSSRDLIHKLKALIISLCFCFYDFKNNSFLNFFFSF